MRENRLPNIAESLGRYFLQMEPATWTVYFPPSSFSFLKMNICNFIQIFRVLATKQSTGLTVWPTFLEEMLTALYQINIVGRWRNQDWQWKYQWLVIAKWVGGGERLKPEINDVFQRRAAVFFFFCKYGWYDLDETQGSYMLCLV